MLCNVSGQLDVTPVQAPTPTPPPGYPAHPIHIPWPGDPGFGRPFPPWPPGGGGGGGAHPEHPIHYPWPGDPGFGRPYPPWPPGGGGGGGGGKPPDPGIWPGPGPIYPPGWGPGGAHPEHPIWYPWPGDPGFGRPFPPWPPGGGGPPPGGGGGPGPPRAYNPLPSQYVPAPAPPDGPPDVASPGTVVIVQDPARGTAQYGWVQTAVDVSEGHEPRPPSQGLPGTWIAAYEPQSRQAVYVWLPSPSAPPEGEKAGRRAPG